ncbi:MAG TPA: zinc ABC transporter substrate-binding protein [Longimicrobium sp.]|jgi:manganese/zinc/iron transport system substrate-binding protein
MLDRAGRWKEAAKNALAALAVAGALAACAPPEPTETQGRLHVVATIGMIKDLVENVGGDHVVVTGLMGPGVDPHLYKASEGDVRKLYRADVIFYGGLHLEARMAEVLEEMGERTRTVAVTGAIPKDSLLAPPEFKGAYDPHVWFDVRLWMMTIDRVEETLAAMDPANAGDYRANAARYRAELDALDRYVRAQAARVPDNKRVLITAHDAFNYFGRAYGFQVRGLQGISTAAEAGTADVQDLARFIATRKIPAVFVESSVPSRTIEAVREAVTARGYRVGMGGSLFSDAMGSPGTPEGSYVGMVRHNIDTIVGALLRDPDSR